MRNLFASDNGTFCRVKRKAWGKGRDARWEAGGRGAAAAQAARAGRTQLWRLLAGHVRSAHRTCPAWL
eukprot:scaffold75318_cov50-Phaeocystis_antarctica.AAC.5